MLKLSKLDKDQYSRLSTSYADISYKISLEDAIGMLGSEWRNSWLSFKCSSSINQILQKYCYKCKAIRKDLAATSVSESTYQEAFGILAGAVQDSEARRLQSPPRLNWRDTHYKSIKHCNGSPRKPDGAFFTSNSDSLKWQDMAVVVEIKGDEMDNENNHIRGQILQDFIDMAEVLPRRFMIGLTIAREGIAYVHICVPGGIYSVHLGNLHLTGDTKPLISGNNLPPLSKEQLVVKFILFLYRQSQYDCRYLTGLSFRFPGQLFLDKIRGNLQVSINTLPQNTNIKFRHGKDDYDRVYGRHKHLRGQRTWAYPVHYTNKNKKEANAFF
ncbi:hypothetical protein COEREDRAFT_96800 [Coemansia reversa NRRL 1564]|uniref:Uncharacterized protein n=1 Tax=Coemansia reversa (strain ATCC 12441 / NRRL 1564) TaxID=763665 RepID=A0A2G5BDW1_COERN|nr:hypothetical protein COEREDRAFT_96800 [Coemansia reversa NRRL 1564]|eukprot:PIA17204.1 hypothetical protein COEREDRAFT_96800 [Coemansia reversa NRRL 1564]